MFKALERPNNRRKASRPFVPTNLRSDGPEEPNMYESVCYILNLKLKSFTYTYISETCPMPSAAGNASTETKQ